MRRGETRVAASASGAVLGDFIESRDRAESVESAFRNVLASASSTDDLRFDAAPLPAFLPARAPGSPVRSPVESPEAARRRARADDAPEVGVAAAPEVYVLELVGVADREVALLDPPELVHVEHARERRPVRVREVARARLGGEFGRVADDDARPVAAPLDQRRRVGAVDDREEGADEGHDRPLDPVPGVPVIVFPWAWGLLALRRLGVQP